MGTVYAVTNQKGGVGKTITTASLGIGLARNGKKVLLVDADPQASLTICLGNQSPAELSETLATAMGRVMQEQICPPLAGVVHHAEDVDLMPASIELSAMEISLVNAMARETILRQYLETVKPLYDFILIDTCPSLGMLTVNALAAADSVIIPVQAEFLAAKGMEQLLRTIARVKRQINPGLQIAGMLLTMVDERNNDTRQIIDALASVYGANLPLLGKIPRSVRAAETSKMGISIFNYDPRGKVADAYDALTKKVLRDSRAAAIGLEVRASA